MRYTKIILSLSALLFSGMVQAQINLTPGQTVVQLTQDVLTGPGLEALNITFNGSAPNAAIAQEGVQFFSTVPGTDFPFNSGVVLRTDGAPSVNLDPDLNALGQFNVTNGSIVEFDFVATGDTMNFKYIFASMEYSGFTCTQFNDVFGFFLSGPGINGPYTNNAINIATIPGTTTPVGINSINSGFPPNNTNCLNANPNYMEDNIYFTTSYNALFQAMPGDPYNGATVALIAASGLICDETYHIKLGIANSADQSLNSIVFLEAESFQVFGYEIVVEPNIQGPTQGGLFAEGCTSATLMIVRTASEGEVTDTICVPIQTSGTLDPATDLLDFPTEICFPPGVDTIYFEFNPIADGIDEGMEELTITLTAINSCGVETPTSVTLYVVDFYDFNYDLTPDQTVQCLTTTAQAAVTNIAGSIEPYTYAWTPNGEDTPTITMTPGTETQETIEHTVTVTDFCGHSVTQTVNLIVNQTLDINPNSGPTACGLSTGFVTFPVIGQTGTVQYQLTGAGIDGTLTQGQQNNLSSGWYYVTVTDGVCSASDSAFIDLLDPPVANIAANPMQDFSPFTTTFVNGSENADSYFWDFGNGETLTTTTTQSQTITYEGEGPLDITVCLIAIQPGCQDTACVVVTILEFIAPPVFAIPNVFSPNGDGNNDTWNFFNLEFVESIEMTILNRWGNVVFETIDPNPIWDGKLPNGNDATEGVYFYKYFLKGLDKTTSHEGHGYFHLIRE